MRNCITQFLIFYIPTDIYIERNIIRIMSKYLKLFETTAAYEAAQSNLILPNVSVCKDQPTVVHYNPSSPTPSLSVTAVYNYCEGGEEVDLPYYDDGIGVCLKFSRPISYDELLGLKFEATYEDEAVEGLHYNANYTTDYQCEGTYIEWTTEDESPYKPVFWCCPFEGTTDTISLNHDDFMIRYFRFYFE